MMDPNTALDLMREAIRDLRHEDAEAHAADLGAWMASGGFEPAGMNGAERRYCRRAALLERTGWAA
jgi:hypothetical protein